MQNWEKKKNIKKILLQDKDGCELTISTVNTLYWNKTKPRSSQKNFPVSAKLDFWPPHQESESRKSFGLTRPNIDKNFSDKILH